MKQIVRFVQLTTIVVVFASLAMADTIPFQWNTTGSFSGAGLPAGLTFSGAPISGITSTAADGSLANINLGYFTFGDIENSYTGAFTLTVNFSRPFGAQNPVSAVTLVANANTNGGNDTLSINFAGPSQFAFSGADGSGTFTFGVANVYDFRNGSHTDTVNLFGNITGAAFTASETAAAVPEPASILLVGSVVCGVAFAAKKKLSRG